MELSAPLRTSEFRRPPRRQPRAGLTFLLERNVLLDVSGFRRTRRWFRPGSLTQPIGGVLLRARQFFEPVGVRWLDLSVEQPCTMRSGWSTSRITCAGSKARKLWNHGMSACRRSPGEPRPSPCPSGPLSESSSGARWSTRAPRLDLGPRRATRSTCAMFRSAPVTPAAATSTSAVMRFSLVGGDQANRAALAVADDREAPAVDIVAVGHEADGRAQVVGEVCEGGRFRASAALSNAALVVAQDQETGVGQRVGELPEDRNARDGLVAIVGPDPPARTTAGSRARPER